MQTFKPTHRCQVDCTNHEEVINNLELKSKDLYFFWKNYEWLYNKYYGQQQQQQPQTKQPEPVVSNREYEQQISRMQRENQRLKIENETLKKQLQFQMNNPNSQKKQSDFQKQIQRLTNKSKDYESINQKQINQIRNLNRALKEKTEDMKDAEEQHRRQSKRQEERIVELQKNIDELRNTIMNTSANTDQILHEKQVYSREVQKLQILLRNIQQRTQAIFDDEIESTRIQLLNEFPNIFKRFSEGNLSSIITFSNEQRRSFIN